MAEHKSAGELLSEAVAPLASGSAGSLAEQMNRLTGQLRQLQTVNEAALESVQTQTQVVKEASASTSSSANSGGGSALSTVLSFLGAGLGVSPLITGIAGLFGGGSDKKEPPPLVQFDLPESRRVSAGVGFGAPGAFAVDYAQGVLPRPVEAFARAPQNVTVQVHAMDSRSFLDHSGDIAAAVRQAMLESSVLNDVVREA